MYETPELEHFGSFRDLTRTGWWWWWKWFKYHHEGRS
jgi:hypothetical protein